MLLALFDSRNNMNISEHPYPVKIAYVGGGSLNWAPQLMADLAQDVRLSAEVRLYDIDTGAAHRNVQMGNRFAEISRGPKARYVLSETLADALRGADVVVVSILPGRFSDMAQDIGIPARYGIAQAVGDTVGPGGFVRALRSVPMLADIGRMIGEHAPDAYVCNLTNPMSVLTGALYRAFPEIKCWGECHEVTKLRKQVAWIANRETGGAPWTHRDVEVNVLGINHFTFVDRIALNGQDMMPAYRAFAEAYGQDGWIAAEPDPDDEFARYFEDRSLVKFDLFRRFGIAAAAGDRHLAEFMPAEDYLDQAQRWKFALTPVEYRVRNSAARREKAESLATGRITPQAKRSDEALVDQIVALMGGKDHVSNVNLPNTGQIENLPKGAIVESNARFSSLGITPLMAGALPASIQPVIADHASRQTHLLDAMMTGDHGALFPLFRTDPLVAPLSTEAARSMFDEMIYATANYLPDSLLAEVA